MDPSVLRVLNGIVCLMTTDSSKYQYAGDWTVTDWQEEYPDS